MQYKSFFIPVSGSKTAEDELNAFLRSHRIITVQKEFSAIDRIWCFLLEYTDEADGMKTTRKIDYMKILSQEDFAVFSKLRELRKKLATEEKIPAYAVFTDEQLSKIVKEKPDTLQKLQNISGIGSAKAEKYGAAFIKIVGSSAQNDFDIF